MAAQEQKQGRPEPRRHPGEFAVIPAVDLLGEEAVRLEQGDFGRVGLRAGDPEALVARYVAHRPAWIHIVDLDGARSGGIRPALVRRLAAVAGDVPLQVSGGIRSFEDAHALEEAGATRLVVGTAAFAERGALTRWVEALGERLVVAVDVKAGRVAVGGWERLTDLAPEAAAQRCAAAGVPRLLCTSAERDGTRRGPDVELLRRVRQASGLPLLGAGGMRSDSDLDALAGLGLEGAIVGRALLEGAVSLSAVAGAFRGRS
jgi:phosphoribosylformimino-5-aminoimidazole carboxamide ribotide isomerase